MKPLLTLMFMMGLALASPALDLFAEATYRLALLYGGSASPAPRDLVPRYRERLEETCAGDSACPEEHAIEAIEALIDELADGHTAYLPPEAYADLLLRLEGGADETGFGIVARAPRFLPGLVILELLPGSPAEAAGLRRGDYLLGLNGRSLPLSRRSRLPALLEAQEEAATLVVLRERRKLLEVTLNPERLARDRLPTLTFLAQDVALLRVPSFLPPTRVAPAFHARLQEAQAAGVERLIVDLRDNPGGAVTDCLSSSAAFVENVGRRIQTTFLTQNLRFEEDTLAVVNADGRRLPQLTLEQPARFTGRVAVLLNARSSSCAEFFALDLQERAIIIGERSAGVADTTTGFFRLPNGAALQVTTAYVSPLTDGSYPPYVTPHIQVNDSLFALTSGRDRVLEAALRLLD